jgi:uncharacterized protein YcbX
MRIAVLSDIHGSYTSTAEAGHGWTLGMPDLVYQTADGLQVTLDQRTWTDHIQHRHPEVTTHDIAQALMRPVRICAHTSNSKRRVSQGPARPSGFSRVSFPLVVVVLAEEYRGRVITAYIERRPYRGEQLWPPLMRS